VSIPAKVRARRDELVTLIEQARDLYYKKDNPTLADIEYDRLFKELQDHLRGVAAGQAAVLYDGTRVIGSATISRSRRSARQ